MATTGPQRDRAPNAIAPAPPNANPNASHLNQHMHLLADPAIFRYRRVFPSQHFHRQPIQALRAKRVLYGLEILYLPILPPPTSRTS